jgi:hypothetical protein
LRPTYYLTAFGNYQHLDYTNIDRTDKTTRFGLALSHEFTKHWSWRAAYTRQIRNSTAIQQSYHENEILFSMVYQR